MKALVNTFAAVAGSIIGMGINLVEKFSFRQSESEIATYQPGNFGKELGTQIEFDLFNRDER